MGRVPAMAESEAGQDLGACAAIAGLVVGASRPKGLLLLQAFVTIVTLDCSFGPDASPTTR
jgi:hypothetical protein